MLRFKGVFPLKKSLTCESFSDSSACITVFSGRCASNPVSTLGIRIIFEPSINPLSLSDPSCSSFSRCSKQMRSLATFNFFAMIFLRFSTELDTSTTTVKLPPVVVVIFNVIGGGGGGGGNDNDEDFTWFDDDGDDVDEGDEVAVLEEEADCDDDDGNAAEDSVVADDGPHPRVISRESLLPDDLSIFPFFFNND